MKTARAHNDQLTGSVEINEPVGIQAMTLEREAEEAVDAEIRADKSFREIRNPDERTIQKLYTATISRELRLRKIAEIAEYGVKTADGPAFKLLVDILTLAKGKP